jgi:hypothetical protein
MLRQRFAAEAASGGKVPHAALGFSIASTTFLACQRPSAAGSG